MKTIFFTVFEGEEARNILRTDAFPTIMSRQDARLVILVKSEGRVEYHQKEFNDPRIIYEVVYPQKPRGMDAFFARLKYTLLRTATTDLRRQMTFGAERNYFGYIWGKFLNRLLARPIVIRLARWLDYRLVRNHVYDSLFDKYKPDLVFLANLFEGPETHLLRAARRRGVKTIALLNSWDKTTARCLLRLLPDRVIAWNEQVKADLIKHDLVRAEDIDVSGIPHYDEYFRDVNVDKEKFLKKLGLPADRKLIVYSPVGRGPAGNADWDVIDMLHELSESPKLREKVSLLVRFPPIDFVDEAQAKARPWLTYDYPGVRFSSKRCIDWDMGFEELVHLRETLAAMSLMICFSSSISVDSVIFDKPVININFNVRPPQFPSRAATEYYKMEHYRFALESGGIREVKNYNELVLWINKYLENPALDREGRRRLTETQCKYTDGKAGERIGKFVLKMLD